MIFFGTYEHNLDDKKRLTIPSKMRSKIDGSILYVSKGFEGSLEMRTEVEFQKWSTQILSLSTFNKQIRMLTREVIANTHEVDLDRSGRINIPDNLLKLAHIERNVFILGMGDRIEIWDTTTFHKYQQDHGDQLEEIAEQVYQGTKQ